MKKIIIILLIVLMPLYVSAAPAITDLNGSVTDDQPLTILGSNFGNNGLAIEWLGGQSGPIESGSDGAQFASTRENWSEVVYPARFDDSRAYSYNKSLIFDSTIDNTGRFGLSYDTGGNISFAYVSYYAYFDNNSRSAGQWKMYRCMPVASVVDSNTPQLIMFNKRNFGGGSNIEWRPQTQSAVNKSLSDGALPNSGEWCRIEMYLQPSSSNGAADGYGQVWTHRPGVSIDLIYNENNMLSYGSSDNRKWRYHVFQNYMGNGYGGTTGTKVWMDDIYISNTKARVEIGNRSTWSNCTQREIQYPTAWSNNSISFMLNRGSIQDGDTAYLFVVDANGDVSGGRQITFGGYHNPLSVLITSPTTGNVFLTSENSINLGGTATDNIAGISWENSKGGSGAIDAATTWNVSGIPLLSGENLITVTATDSSGDISSDQLTVTYSDIIKTWDATEQTNDSSWANSSVTYCVRLLIEGNYVTESGNQIRLGFQGRGSGNYAIRKVSIAEKDTNGDEGDVIDSTWTHVIFDGKSESSWATDTVTVQAESEKISDLISFNMQAEKDYYVTFKIDSPSVYLDPPSSYRELYFISDDHTSDVDWSGNGYATRQDYHALSKIYVSESDDAGGTERPSAPVLNIVND